MTKTRNYKSESIREFNNAAAHYDDHSPFYYRMTRLCDDAVLEQISKTITPNCRLLDVGCGTGALLEKIQNQFQNIQLNGIDISSQMIEIATQRQSLKTVSFVEGDSENLPYEDHRFDIITCCSSFHHYPNPQIALSEFKRVLKPCGNCIICDMDLPAIARFFANHIIFPFQHKGDVHVYTRNEIRNLMENQAFIDCRVEKITRFEWMAVGVNSCHILNSTDFLKKE